MENLRVISGSRGIRAALAVFVFLAAALPAAAESEVRVNMELFTTVYRGQTDWYFTGSGMADLRFAAIGNRDIRGEAAVEFHPVDLSGGGSVSGVPTASLKRLWFKANFPNWRLTAGKTKLGWGNGFVFNSGDVLFGALSPYLDFTSSSVRDDTAFLVAVNIPLGRFSYIEGVILPPGLKADFSLQPIHQSSGGMRVFFRAGGWRFETGYLYKGDAKVMSDLLGHRPYFSFHGHGGVDWYGAFSLAAAEGAAWDDVSKTINFSLGMFHQFSVAYDTTMTIRLETLIMPRQNWSAQAFQDMVDGTAGYYGIMIYPEVMFRFAAGWTLGLQSVISPIDASAQITLNAGWEVLQGLTLLGYFVINAGDGQSLFAYDRSNSADWPEYAGTGTDWAPQEFNGINLTLGARYSY